VECRNPTLAKCGGEAQHLEKLGIWSPPGLLNVQSSTARPKTPCIGCSWCHWNGLETKISKMASHWPFGHLQPKLWAKEGPGVKLAIWLLTTKSRESTFSRHPIRVCDMALERSRQGLQLWFGPRRDRTLQLGGMAVQSSGSLARTISGVHFGSPFRESWEFVPFGCSLHGELQRILYGGRWWLPPSPGRGESCVSKCLWLVPTPKGVPNAKLTSCGWFLDADSHKLS
jgi:hypothetical protein